KLGAPVPKIGTLVPNSAMSPGSSIQVPLFGTTAPPAPEKKQQKNLLVFGIVAATTVSRK
ncbi:hypothetical protein PanWU01x14_321220, partial [Parasponia andersonii]